MVTEITGLNLLGKILVLAGIAGTAYLSWQSIRSDTGVSLEGKASKAASLAIIGMLIVTFSYFADGAIFYNKTTRTELETVDRSYIVERIKDHPGSGHLEVKPDTVEILSVRLEDNRWIAKFRCQGRVWGPPNPLKDEKKPEFHDRIVWAAFDPQTGFQNWIGSKALRNCPSIVKHYENGKMENVTWRDNGYRKLLKTVGGAARFSGKQVLMPLPENLREQIADESYAEVIYPKTTIEYRGLWKKNLQLDSTLIVLTGKYNHTILLGKRGHWENEEFVEDSSEQIKYVGIWTTNGLERLADSMGVTLPENRHIKGSEWTKIASASGTVSGLENNETFSIKIEPVENLSRIYQVSKITTTHHFSGNGKWTVDIKDKIPPNHHLVPGDFSIKIEEVPEGYRVEPKYHRVYVSKEEKLTGLDFKFRKISNKEKIRNAVTSFIDAYNNENAEKMWKLLSENQRNGIKKENFLDQASFTREKHLIGKLKLENVDISSLSKEKTTVNVKILENRKGVWPPRVKVSENRLFRRGEGTLHLVNENGRWRIDSPTMTALTGRPGTALSLRVKPLSEKIKVGENLNLKYIIRNESFLPQPFSHGHFHPGHAILYHRENKISKFPRVICDILKVGSISPYGKMSFVLEIPNKFITYGENQKWIVTFLKTGNYTIKPTATLEILETPITLRGNPIRIEVLRGIPKISVTSINAPSKVPVGTTANISAFSVPHDDDRV
ncbi:hypothetical protein AKJ36_02075 [candidate division MSBL1 archaeon SCGC-AAA259I07]|uniref:Uncharacterized protein n=1 Tax=candidate division MSBL1 archaeon SCGC-AAA259I07 TaxID=1698266 RepID=A0A133UKZ4_9EURY|nr:hypothetical protein AKJ36_02075 [candidate division MSBL1 archaeon SCGC-AAA259I07]